MLLLYKAGKGTDQVFKEAIGLELKDFDTRFLGWVDDRTKDIDEKKFTDLVCKASKPGERRPRQGDCFIEKRS